MRTMDLWNAKMLLLFFIIPLSSSLSQPPNIRVTNNGNLNSETAIAINSQNPAKQLICWNQHEIYSKLTCAATIDSWATQSVTKFGISGGDAPWEFGFDPSCGIDATIGRSYCCYVACDHALGYGDVSTAVYLVSSDDDGQQWNIYTPVSDIIYNSASAWMDKPYMTVDQQTGIIRVTWTSITNANHYKILTRYSTDYGASFPAETEQVVYDYDIGAGAGGYPTFNPESDVALLKCAMPFPDLHVGTYRVFNALTEPTTGKIVVTKSVDGEAPRIANRNVGSLYSRLTEYQSIDIYPILSVGADAARGNLYITYASPSSSQTNDWKCYFVRSLHNNGTDGGDDWSAPVELGNLGGGIQFFPWVSVDQNTGIITVSFLHSTGIGGGDYLDLYSVESADEGATFYGMRRITSVPTNVSSSGGWRALHYMGQYASGNSYFPAWTDFRNGGLDIYTSKLTNTPSTDVAAATCSGQSAKLVFNSTSNTFHQVYQQITNEVWYTVSTDGGGAWSIPERVSGTVGAGPLTNSSIALDASGNPHVVWARGDGIYYARKTSGAWSQPMLLRSEGYSSISPAFRINTASNTGYVVWCAGNCVLDPTRVQPMRPAPCTNYWYLRYGTFNIQSPSPTLTSTNIVTSTTNIAWTPSIALVGSTPHVLWVSGNNIYYSFKNGSAWTTPSNLSSTTLSACQPTIMSYGAYLYASWSELVSGPAAGACNRIFYSQNLNGVWTPKYQASVAKSGENYNDAQHPYFAGVFDGKPALLWSQRMVDNYLTEIDPFRIWYDYSPAIFSQPLQWVTASTSQKALYINAVGKSIGVNTARIYYSYTEGGASPYAVPFSWDDINTGPTSISMSTQRYNNVLPTKFNLSQNYPNPFNSSTTIMYSVPAPDFVKIKVYDLLGRELQTLVDAWHAVGEYPIQFNASDLASGVYYYRIVARNFSDTKKMVLMR